LTFWAPVLGDELAEKNCEIVLQHLVNACVGLARQ
jgi:hypothetical protein